MEKDGDRIWYAIAGAGMLVWIMFLGAAAGWW